MIEIDGTDYDLPIPGPHSASSVILNTVCAAHAFVSSLWLVAPEHRKTILQLQACLWSTQAVT